MTLACADRGVRWASLVEPPDLSEEYLVPILHALVWIDIMYLRKHHAPPLYRAGVVYRSEAEGEEHWRAIPIVQRLGYADCKSLAAWRCAELRKAGEPARVSMTVRDFGNGKRLWHIVVKRSSGRFEDPSRILGMK